MLPCRHERQSGERLPLAPGRDDRRLLLRELQQLFELDDLSPSLNRRLHHAGELRVAEQIGAHLDIPVVYLTAYADEATLQRAKITEPFGYLLKPFEERTLHSTVEMALYRAIAGAVHVEPCTCYFLRDPTIVSRS